MNGCSKRMFDLFGSLIGLTVASPVILFTSIAIKTTSNGPVLFRQKRLGKDGKVFKIYKFRTMIDNAEKIGTGLSTYEGDPRITRVGELLRKTSLDELPQLINVVYGDMSIIGPRPPVPYHPKEYSMYNFTEKKRFNVLPGITGYAQIKGRNSLTWEERIRYDVEYVNNQNLKLDLKIFFLTILKIFKSEGIHGPTRRKKKRQV